MSRRSEDSFKHLVQFLDKYLVMIPAVTRKKKTSLLFCGYLDKHKGDNVKPLGKYTFYKVIKSLTTRDEKRKSAGNYFVGSLANDRVLKHKHLIKAFFHPSTISNF